MHFPMGSQRFLRTEMRVIRLAFAAMVFYMFMPLTVCEGQSNKKTLSPREKEIQERKEKLRERFGKTESKSESQSNALGTDAEYYRLAPYLSMDFVMTPPIRERRVGGAERALESDDGAFQQALDLHRVAELLKGSSHKLLTGSSLSDHQKTAVGLLFDDMTAREIREDVKWDEYAIETGELAKKIINWSLNPELENGIPVSASVYRELEKQSKREELAEKLFLKSRELEIASWKSIEQFMPQSERSHDISSSIAMEIRVDTTTRHSGHLILRNTSDQDLQRVTLKLSTHVSRRLQGHLKEFYLYLPLWKKDASISLDKTLISGLLHGEIKTPVSEAIHLSLWSEQGVVREQRYDLPKEKPAKMNVHLLIYQLKIQP